MPPIEDAVTTLDPATAARADARATLGDAEGRALLRYARERIRQALHGPLATRPRGEWSDAWGATFVTIRRDGRLHGCIGSIEPRRAIADDVGHNAVAAALVDPRAESIELADVEDLTIEISVLSPLSPIACTDEASAIAALRPGVDGVVIRAPGRQGTFLPQVWRDLPDRRDFFRELKLKAGIPERHWSPDIRVLRYSMIKFADSDLEDER
jgi:uncharacterized protein